MKFIKPALTLLSGAVVLSACSGEPEWVAVYEDCKKQITLASEDMNKASSEENPEMKAMMESMGNMTLNIGLTACEMIKSHCENDPEGAACQSIIEQSRNSK